MICKIFFCSEFPDIPEKSWRKEEEIGNYEVFCFSSKRNKERTCFNKISF